MIGTQVIDTSAAGIRSRIRFASEFRGGEGGHAQGTGVAGTAVITANVINSEGTQNDAEALAWASHRRIWNVRAAHGTNAIAESRALSLLGDAKAKAVARGGWGFITSGIADAESSNRIVAACALCRNTGQKIIESQRCGTVVFPIRFQRKNRVAKGMRCLLRSVDTRERPTWQARLFLSDLWW